MNWTQNSFALLGTIRKADLAAISLDRVGQF